MKLRSLRKGYHLVGDAVSEIRVILDLGPNSLRRRHELAIASSMKGCDKAGARSDREVANWFQLLLWEMNCCCQSGKCCQGISQELEAGRELRGRQQERASPLSSSTLRASP